MSSKKLGHNVRGLSKKGRGKIQPRREGVKRERGSRKTFFRRIPTGETKEEKFGENAIDEN